MITIKPSPTADTRSCDFANVTREELETASRQHIQDVEKALWFFSMLLDRAAAVHDVDKIVDIDSFHEDFVTGFAQTEWYDRHRVLNRHHLAAADGVPLDVNLIDVLDYIADCVMAGMARSGEVYELKIAPEVMQAAFSNTVAMLQRVVTVDKEE